MKEQCKICIKSLSEVSVKYFWLFSLFYGCTTPHFLLPQLVSLEDRTIFSSHRGSRLDGYHFFQKKKRLVNFQPPIFMIPPHGPSNFDNQKGIPMDILSHTGSADLGRFRLVLYQKMSILKNRFFSQKLCFLVFNQGFLIPYKIRRVQVKLTFVFPFDCRDRWYKSVKRLKC